jgi:uncharacterized protein (TIGR02117 family)
MKYLIQFCGKEPFACVTPAASRQAGPPHGASGYAYRRTHASKLIPIVYFVFCIIYSILHSQPLNSSSKDTLHTIHIVSHGWHTGVVLSAEDLPKQITRQPDFPSGIHLEFGWGDRDFYQNPDNNFWRTAKAALWPTESVIHVVSFSLKVKEYFSHSDLVQIDLTQTELDGMVEYILSSFKYDSSGAFIYVGDGLYGESRFYAGSRSYIFPKTCNVWTAACLQAAGMDITPMYYQRANKLMQKLKEMQDEGEG